MSYDNNSDAPESIGLRIFGWLVVSAATSVLVAVTVGGVVTTIEMVKVALR